jgi:HAD superfamily hydrolase (TIGR01509 family)
MTSVSVVLFDLGNVLIRIHPEAFATTLDLDSPESKSTYHSRVIDLVRRYEDGEFSTEKFFETLGKILKEGHSRARLEQAMANVIGAPVAGMEQLLHTIRSKGLQTALVSNTNEFHLRYCLEHFPFLHTLSRRYCSYELRCLKPDPKFYRRVLADVDCPAERILFVDDLGENIEGAQKHGMIPHLFKDSTTLSRTMKELGVPV